MKIKLYIEGGGDSALQDTLFREGWQVFFSESGLGESDAEDLSRWWKKRDL